MLKTGWSLAADVGTSAELGKGEEPSLVIGDEAYLLVYG
jgi:hypothetical protein